MMNDRENLIQKRKALQAKLKEDKRRAHLKDQIDFLERTHIDYQIHFDNPISQWMHEDLALKTYGIGLAWEHYEHAVQISIPDKEDAFEKLSEVISQHLSPTEKAYIIYSNWATPELEVRTSVFQSAPEIFFDYFECWLVNESKTFVLEYLSMDGKHTWMKIPEN